ncbi:O-fucosyltransferase family protein [Enterocloster lavalensis]|uniref:hypothetical protein n=1 Tax=Enterocloster lavalensis TaxID=460384 RepID=UPI0011B285AA|nr:hypothetical protein [Enterocloster lavalensis]
MKILEHLLVSIRRVVEKRPFFKCCLKFIYRLPHKEFQEYVARYIPTKYVDGKTIITRNLSVVTLGQKNPNRVILLTERNSGSGGFCAEWIYWLNRLNFSDQMGFLHCFNWTNSQFFVEKSMKNKNIFEHYFEQPYGLEVKDVKQSKHVIIDKNSIDYGYYDVFAPGRDDDYMITDDDFYRLSQMQKKYIRLEEKLKEEIERDISRMIDSNKILAVHARGADAQVNYKNHPIPIGVDKYIEETEKSIELIGANKVFLATDDNNILKAFIEKYQERLIYYKDVERSDGLRMSCYGEIQRKQHHYRLGKEIIKDVYTLAACDGLVCSASYVSYMARIVKMASGKSYQTINSISSTKRTKGMNLTDPLTIKKVETIWNQELKIAKKEK